MQNEQAGHRPGPVHLYVPLPSYGAMFLASSPPFLQRCMRGKTPVAGQWVETSLMQGVVSFHVHAVVPRRNGNRPEVFAGGHGPFRFKDTPGHAEF